MRRLGFAMLLLVGCGGASLKHAGQTCSASSECDKGLLCDLAQSPPVCAGMGVVQPPDAAGNPPDAAKSPPDAKPTPDAAPDAAPLDAPPVDAPPIDAPPPD